MPEVEAVSGWLNMKKPQAGCSCRLSVISAFSIRKKMCVCLLHEHLSLRQSYVYSCSVLQGTWACSQFTQASFCSPASAAGISNSPVWFLSWEGTWRLPAKGGRARWGFFKVTQGWLGLGPGKTLSLVSPVPRLSLCLAFTRRIQTAASALGKLDSPWTKTALALGSFLRALLS